MKQAAEERALLQARVSALGSAVSYNDKGAEWSGHTSARIAEVQGEYQAELIALATRVGESRLGARLWSAITSDEAARGCTGRHVRLAENLLD